MKKTTTKTTLHEKIQDYLSFVVKQPKGFVFSEKNHPQKNYNHNGNAESLNKLKTQYQNCTKCPLATQGRTNIVFGWGNPNAKLMLVGEGPGRDEDRQAIPFVGKAGQLLTKILAAINLKKDDVYITNVVKCRPPGNRAPQPNESEICKSILLLKEIEIIKPIIICTLGATAMQVFLGPHERITRARGRLFKFNNSLIIPTFHPAYLLRNPTKKRNVWSDMKTIAAALYKLQQKN